MRVFEVGQQAVLDKPGYLSDPLRHRELSYEPELGAHLREGHPIVAWILIAMNVLHAAAVRVGQDHLDQLPFLVMLRIRADVVYLTADTLHWSLHDCHHGAGSVAGVHVRAPELLSEDLQPSLGHELHRKLVDGQVESHPGRAAKESGKAEH